MQTSISCRSQTKNDAFLLFSLFLREKISIAKGTAMVEKIQKIGISTLRFHFFFSNNKYLCSTTTLAEKFGHLVLRKILILTFDLFFFFVLRRDNSSMCVN